jgi:hypothetical protein
VLRLLTEQAQFAMRRENGAGLAGVAA